MFVEIFSRSSDKIARFMKSKHYLTLIKSCVKLIFMKRIIGIVGFIGSGKNTVGDHLVNLYDFEAMSFASSLKDAVSSIFGWPRHMIEGSTSESRKWREEPDEYWSKKMERLITPRFILQHIGTDILKTYFSTNIWLWSLESRMMNSNKSIVITDVRFPNEIEMINSSGGDLWWVQRGHVPSWYSIALTKSDQMPSNIHITEYAWLADAIKTAKTLNNNGTLPILYGRIEDLLK